MEIIGRIKAIGHTQDISSSFRKRELVVVTNEQYPQNIMIEFTQDKVNLLDTFQIGDYVKIAINLRGREWTNPQGEVKYFNTIQGWKIEPNVLIQPQNQQQGSAVDAYNQQQNGYPQQQQQQFQQQGGYQTNHNQLSTTQQNDQDDLPF